MGDGNFCHSLPSAKEGRADVKTGGKRALLVASDCSLFSPCSNIGEMVDKDEVCEYDSAFKKARLQKADEILGKPLESFKQEEVVQDLQTICFERIYFIKNLMIPCTDPDEELDEKLGYPVTKLEDIDKVTLVAQERLLSLMGEFALPWEHFNEKKSVLTVQHVRFTFEKWYCYLLEEFSMAERFHQYTWNFFLKLRLYPLLRLCTKWLRCASENKMCHGDLMHCIYFKTDMEPKLLIQKGDGCGSYKGDLETIRHFLFVIVNRRPPEELQMVNRLNYYNFNDDVPRYLIDFLKLLDTFDEQKHIVDVVFNPSFLWSIEKKFKHLDEAYMYFFEVKSRLNKINKHHWWRWYADFEKLPKDHAFKKVLERESSTGLVQSHQRGSVPFNPTYQNNAQLLRLCRNARCHVTEMFAEFEWTQDDVLEEFDEKFNILSKLSQTCNKYAMGLQCEQFCADFLERLGYITRETL
ncbi:hypothetical protein SLEP1_g56490 [Rubroshorea leprosula]|uniref:Uncharacterized protein n=1 Tax=Rubroshorea leprosula TaxID=152421 RepID=A0AAV5MJR3_9ROSI|nr:hypothetical protein SLEP1_g56490 [Rubroshorea leprosula]